MNILKENPASIFSADMCNMRNWLGYIKKFARKVATLSHGRASRE
jgi:hypothetical protein